MDLMRWLEISLYALLSFLPFAFLAVHPFRDKMRFSKVVSIFGVVLLLFLRIGFTYLTSVADRRGPVVLMGTIVCTLFYFIFIKDHVGKCLFVLLVLTNISNFTLTAAKCIEKRLFPVHFSEPYNWSSSLILFFVELIVLIPLFFYLKRVFNKTVMEDNHAWKYLWLIPLTFYAVWFRNFYFSAEGSVVLVGRLRYLFFTSVVNAGAMLIYTMVAQLMHQYGQNVALKEKAHQLAMQHTLYGNIQDRIEEVRRAKHDIKQHLHVVASYLQEKKYEELEIYLEKYQHSMALDTPILFCENPVVNALLQYFAGYAKIIHAGFSASVSLPSSIGIPDEALTVVLGNLLENALEACSYGDVPGAVISVHGKVDKGALFFKVVNTCLTPPKTDSKGNYYSSKREGYGIGLQSVKNITKQYDGMMKAHFEDGQFIVSVLLNIPK